MKSNDMLWKGIIEDCLEYFLQFFFADEFHQFDLSKPVEFLEQELQQLYPEGKGKGKRLDKLIKVYLKNGTARWILIHIEVQGYKDGKYSFRMFEYFYRSLDRFKIEICALAIFTDANRDFHPKSYETELLGTKLSYTYKTYKVIEQSEEELLASDNPFAMVVYTVLQAIRKGKFDQKELYDLKWSIARRLIELKYDKKFLNSLFWFMNNYLSFDNTEENRKFADKFTQEFQLKEKNMGVIEIIREDLRKEALAKAKAKGIEESVIKAFQKGMSVADISFYFELSIAQVERIVKGSK